jgi:catechol 2,3-dioxygenase-like lactoylglutathione lyase family enzyme
MAAIRLIVDDVEAAIAFYTGRLGFAVERRWGPPFASITRGDLTLWLSGPGSSASRPMADGSRPAPGGWNRPVIEVSDIAATLAAMRHNGVVVRNDIVTGPGGKQALLQDPSGNLIEIFEPAR